MLSSQGDWWLNHRGNWLGYYSAGDLPLFGSSGEGCYTAWYGEVFDPSPTNWTSTNMGSGRFASEGWKKAAYVRNPYYANENGVALWAEGTGSAGDSTGVGSGGFLAGPRDGACYTTSGMLRNAGQSAWERYFYLGGPGGDAAGCN